LSLFVNIAQGVFVSSRGQTTPNDDLRQAALDANFAEFSKRTLTGINGGQLGNDTVDTAALKLHAKHSGRFAFAEMAPFTTVADLVGFIYSDLRRRAMRKVPPLTSNEALRDARRAAGAIVPSAWRSLAPPDAGGSDAGAPDDPSVEDPFAGLGVADAGAPEVDVRSAIVIRFDPALFGLRFMNNFPDARWLDVIRAPGLCGGCAFTVLDYYNADVAAPTTTTTPATNTPLGAYIKQRQIDSFVANGLRFLAWIMQPIDSILAQETSTASWRQLRALVDAQTPVPLGLVAAPYGLGNATRSHQVVAVGYREEGGSRVVVCWDPNHPGGLSEIRHEPSSGRWVGPGRNDRWRGWFLETYKPMAPPASPQMMADAS
jgi:hypothetical protein